MNKKSQELDDNFYEVYAWMLKECRKRGDDWLTGWVLTCIYLNQKR